MGVAQPHKFKQLLHHRAADFPVHLLPGIIVAVDIPALLGFFQQLDVVAAGQQPDVIHLRNTGGEKLNRPGQQIGRVLVSQGGIVGAVDLVNIQIVIGRGVVNLFDVGAFGEQRLLGGVDFLLRHQIGHIHHADAVVGIQGGELPAGTDVQPVHQFLPLAGV